MNEILYYPGGFWDFNSRQDFRRATPIEIYITRMYLRQPQVTPTPTLTPTPPLAGRRLAAKGRNPTSAASNSSRFGVAFRSAHSVHYALSFVCLIDFYLHFRMKNIRIVKCLNNSSKFFLNFLS